jgi:hypothetical protein
MNTAAASPNFAAPRSEIGGYEVVRTLAPDQSWLAAAGGRVVVLKALDEDCLWKGQLHPNVKDRLERVRELAHAGVANLYGVERDEGLTYLVWEFVQGETLDEYARAPKVGARQFLLLARELVLSVEMLHARGLVHGTLKGSNVIVNAEGRVVITHISPLLYSEPAEDVRAVIALLTEMLDARGEAQSPLGLLLARAVDEEMTPRRLAAGMGGLIEAHEGEAVEPPERGVGKRIRRRALLGAGATAALGVAVFVAVKQYAGERAPRPPVPPQAAPAALHESPRGESPSAAVGFRRAGQ